MVTKIYANAVAKYNEGKLLDSEKLYRLVDAEFSDAVKMLCDYGYGGGTVDEKSYDIDAFISSETAALIAYAWESAPNDYVARILTNRFLYGNAKAYFKARITGKTNAAAVYGMQDEEVRTAIEKGEYASLPAFMAEAVQTLDVMFADTAPDPKTIDIVLTKAMFADNAYCARKARDKSLKTFVAGEIDLTNIMTVFRARSLGMPVNALGELLIDGGKMPDDVLQALFTAEDPVAVLFDSPYGFLAENEGGISLPHLEARADDYLAQIWERSSENMLSLSPFIGYFLAQSAEYKTVKMILTCLKNNARAEILPRLRAVARN